jgi:hypothetical protein
VDLRAGCGAVHILALSNTVFGDEKGHVLLLRPRWSALQTEIQRHSLSSFVDPNHRVTVPGCPLCKQSFGTVDQFVRHLTDDVLPPLLDKLSSENNDLSSKLS